MQKSPLQFKQTVSTTNDAHKGQNTAFNANVPDVLAVTRLPQLAEEWFADCQMRQHSPRTIELRRSLFGRLIWFLEDRGAQECNRAEIRQFFVYLSNGHQGTDGRWGKEHHRFKNALRPASVSSYFHHLRTFFNWLVGEEYLLVSPMEKLAPPVSRPNQVQPFTSQQIESLLQATRHSMYPKRDEAIVRFLLDTGVRVTELCTLRMRDLSLMEGQAFVLGKGNKMRMICFGRRTARVLRAYLRDEERMPDQHVFLSERGENAGSQFTRWGISQVLERLETKAGLQGVRCSPHTFRHTFAVEFLRNGGNVFTLMQLLGHTTLAMTKRYVALAQADIQSQHRQFSPGDRLGK